MVELNPDNFAVPRLLFCLIEILMILAGKSVIAGRMIVLVAICAVLSAISSPEIPTCDDNQINSTVFVFR